MGYLKANSVGSLVAGAGSGVLVLGLSALGPNKLVPVAQCFIAAALSLLMGSRAASSGKFMPGGLVAVMSVVQVVLQSAAISAGKGKAV